jgi:hypothetical protein
MPAAERILSIGITGAGKTYQYLKMAQKLKSTGAKFYVLDTDRAVDYMLDTQFPDLKPENGGNVSVFNAYDWEQYKAFLKWVDAKNPKPDDWVVIDMMDNAWKSVQRYFSDQVFSKEMGDYFLQVRKEVEKQGGKGDDGKKVTNIVKEGMDGWVDWTVINKLYDDWAAKISYRLNCHVYATAKVTEVAKNEKNPEVLQMYGAIGVKPGGQKDTGHLFHTILLFKPGKEKWFIDTIKDRAGRVYFDNTPLTSLYMQYMVLKAGWKIPGA